MEKEYKELHGQTGQEQESCLIASDYKKYDKISVVVLDTFTGQSVEI